MTNLQSTLTELTRSGWQSNPAMKTIIDDYAEHHMVLVVAGGCLTLVFVLLSVFSWTRCKRTPKATRRTWASERTIYLSFGLLSSILALCTTLIVAANATNALDPVSGFSPLIGSLGPGNSALRQAFDAWIRSGSSTVPPLIQQHVHERIAFHTTKAIVSAMLLVVLASLSLIIWRALIERDRVSESRWRLEESLLLASGIATVALSLLMLVTVVANLQGAVASLTLTLLYG